MVSLGTRTNKGGEGEAEVNPAGPPPPSAFFVAGRVRAVQSD